MNWKVVKKSTIFFISCVKTTNKQIMNTLKLLAFVRLYTTYIFQVRVKYYLTTKSVQIKRMLRPLSSDFCLTNFAPTSTFHVVGQQSSSAVPLGLSEGDPKPTRRNSEQRWEKGRSWSGIGRLMLCCIAVVFQSSNYSFKELKSIRALALLALMVSMFSLSAQTPRKDSGADGLSQIKALNIGDKIPQSLWDMPLRVVNHPTGQKTIKLSEYRSKKLIILDFWATWCASCVESLGKIQHKLNYSQSDIVFIPITFQSDTVVTKFQHSNKVAGEWQFPLVVDDKLLKQLFPHATISHFVWIDSDGTIKAFTSSEYITDTQLQKGLKGNFANVKMKIDQIDFDPKQPLLIPELADLKAHYTGFRKFLIGVAPTSGMQDLDSLGLKRRYFVNTNLRSLCMDAVSDIQGVQLAKKKIVYEVIDENRYFNKERVNADVYNHQYGLCYEAVLPTETTKAAFRETLRNDLWQHFKIKLTIEERPIPVIALYSSRRNSPVSKDETIALKTLIDRLNVRDNDIPYVICPTDLQNLPVPSNLKDCTSTKLLIERLAQSGIKADQRKENLAVLVITERRGA